MKNEININYITATDVGNFTSHAKLDLETGVVFDIESIDDDEIEQINAIHSAYIVFNYLDKQYRLPLDFDNETVENYRGTDFYRVLMLSKAEEKLNKDLPKKDVKPRSFKV